MRDQLYRLLPPAFGLLLGWLLFRPPVWLESLGPLAYLFHAVLCALLLVSFVAWLILANLPARLELSALAPEQVPAELRRLGDRIERLGFRPAGPPRRVELKPPAILLGWVHAHEPVYATAFRLGDLEGKVSYDFVSILHGDRGALTTNADPAGASLPAGPGGLRQVLPGATLETLLESHLDGIAYLRQHGVHCRAVSPDTFAQDVGLSIRRQREQFLASPLRSSLVALWRAATRRVPFVGRLREQKIAESQIAHVLRA